MQKLIAPQGQILTDDAIRQFVAGMAASAAFDGKRVLAIIPDDTRTAPIPQVFRAACDLIRPRAAQLDFLIALGTHRPMPEDRIAKLIGMELAERERAYPGTHVFNHRWDEEGTLGDFGRISAAEVERLTDGYIKEEIVVLLNKMILDYDLLLIFGPTFPHEVIGFSGGNKYFFPGISGGDLINFTHWLGALHTIPNIIGVKDTPVRRMVDRAAGFIPRKKLCLSLVVTKKGPVGMYFDTPEAAFSQAADLSAGYHIVTKTRRYHTILAECPLMYDEIWTAGKCMYKLMCVLEKGGKLIIYAPHINEVAFSHNEWLHKVGYHVRDYFTGQPEKFKDVPGCIMAHSSHVRGTGCFKDGVEYPDAEVILATAIAPDECEQIALGYMDPATIRVEDYKNREDEGILFVPEAGEYLYRCEVQD